MSIRAASGIRCIQRSRRRLRVRARLRRASLSKSLGIGSIRPLRPLRTINTPFVLVLQQTRLQPIIRKTVLQDDTLSVSTFLPSPGYSTVETPQDGYPRSTQDSTNDEISDEIGDRDPEQRVPQE